MIKESLFLMLKYSKIEHRLCICLELFSNSFIINTSVVILILCRPEVRNRRLFLY